MAAGFELFTPDDVGAFLKEEVPNISEVVLEKITERKIDGEVFLALNDEYLREITPFWRQTKSETGSGYGSYHFQCKFERLHYLGVFMC